ncbi:hypothetical protein [Mesorhizobium sp.]|uniref:hypothetical protein n=1 Tax=Mesorhizobium sp. TaxID=1871066 RepID=UPI000FE8D792|nr:hypothetical protein [Mesorhizobium sp.]RWO57267.1 MAG: hypothetical protein EOS14_23680 [Mesorhizobium sp.]
MNLTNATPAHLTHGEQAMTTVNGSPSAQTNKTIRFRSANGITATWRFGKTREGKFKALSISKPRFGTRPLILDFLPFEMKDAVYNRHIVFDSLDAAELYARSL